MGHTSQKKTKLTARVKRIRGQMESIERALQADAGCTEIIHLIASVRGAMNGLMGEVVEDHIREHIARQKTPAAREDAAEEVIEIVKLYLK